jgi:hypothetical protein
MGDDRLGWRWCPLPLLQGGRLWCYPVVLEPGGGAKRNHLLLTVPLDQLLGHERQRLGVAMVVALSSDGGFVRRQIGHEKGPLYSPGSSWRRRPGLNLLLCPI